MSQSWILCSDRAEGLKQSQSRSAAAQNHDKSGSSGSKSSTAGGSGGAARQFFPLGPDFSLGERSQAQPVRAVQSSEPQGQRYTAEEREVLRSDLEPPHYSLLRFLSVTNEEVATKIYIFNPKLAIKTSLFPSCSS